jgi:hypothetical protein
MAEILKTLQYFCRTLHKSRKNYNNENSFSFGNKAVNRGRVVDSPAS